MASLVFLAGAAVLAATATLAAATMRLQGAAFLLGAYLAAWTEVVLLAEAASPLHAIGRTSYAVGEGALLAVAAVAWNARGRPRPAFSRPTRADVARHPVVVGLALIVLCAIAYEAFIALAIPPNNVDALTYHLPRAAAWLRHGTLGYFPANTARDNAFPIVAEVGVLYTFVLSGRDTFAALPQLIAELALIVAVYGTSCRLGFTRAGSLFAALLTATLSEIALESTSAQNDLVVAAFVACSVFFLLARDRRELPLVAIAAALAVGAKLTALFALPIVAILALVLLPRRRAGELAAWSVATFVLLGAWTYVANLEHTGHVLGVVPEDAAFVPAITAASTISTVAHVYYRFVDFSGLPISAGAGAAVANAGRWLFTEAGIAPPVHRTWFGFAPNVQSNEDTSYFGVLGALLVIPLSIGFLAAGVLSRRWRSPRLILACALPSFAVVLALANTYNPWLGRFMVIPVVLTMPLVGWLYDRRLNVVAGALTGVAAVTLAYTQAYNFYKPTGVSGTGPAIWTMSRVDAQTVATPGLAFAVDTVDRLVPPRASLGIALTSGDEAYPLYGPHLSRTLVDLPGRDSLAAARRRDIDWVVAARARSLGPRGGWAVLRLGNGWQLARRLDTKEGSRPRRSPASLAAGAGDSR